MDAKMLCIIHSAEWRMAAVRLLWEQVGWVRLPALRRGRRIVVIPQLSKLMLGVRFPSPAHFFALRASKCARIQVWTQNSSSLKALQNLNGLRQPNLQ